MTCPKCNFQNPEETLVCQNCKTSLSRKKNWWKIGLAILIVVAVGIYVLGKYTKKNSYPIKPTIDKVEFVYTSPTPPPPIIVKIGDTLDYRNLQTDTSNWKEYKKEVDGLLITFKYPKQYKIWKYGSGKPLKFDTSIVNTNASGHLEDTLVDFWRPNNRGGKGGEDYPITYDGKPLTRWVQEGNHDFVYQASIIREVIVKFKKIVRIEYKNGNGPISFTHPDGPRGETYVVVDNNHPFIFDNYNLIPLGEFIAILDSFKVEKCLEFC